MTKPDPGCVTFRQQLVPGRATADRATTSERDRLRQLVCAEADRIERDEPQLVARLYAVLREELAA